MSVHTKHDGFEMVI